MNTPSNSNLPHPGYYLYWSGNKIVLKNLLQFAAGWSADIVGKLFARADGDIGVPATSPLSALAEQTRRCINAIRAGAIGLNLAARNLTHPAHVLPTVAQP
jgi:hypothetical protein